MFLVILTGAPASGKSSLAESLSNALNIPWVSKDMYKVKLFEQYGFRSHAEKKKLSICGEEQLIKRIERAILQNSSLIVDNNFKNFNAVREILSRHQVNCKVICFYLYADSALLARRYNERISSGNREQSLYTLNVYPVVDGVSEFHKPLTAAQVDDIQKNVTEETFGDIIVKINTDQLETKYDTVFQQLLGIIQENVKEF